MQSDYYINLHFNQAVAQRTGYAFKIGDKGCTFHFHCEDLDPSGMFPHIVFNHPNNTCVEGVPTGSGRDYAYTIAGNEFGVCGKTVVDLKFYDNNNDATQRISTASFMIEIIPDTYTDFEESSSSYADSLERAREEIDAAILELQGAEHDLEEAEGDLDDMSEEFANTLQDYIDAFGNTAPINPRGAYVAATEYHPRDAVEYTAGGKTLTYINRETCTGIAPTDPDEGAAHWQIMIDVAVGGSFSALSDVSVDPQTLADGQVPVYDATGQTWENKTILENSLTSTATDKALTAAKGKELQDNKQDKTLETALTINETTQTTVEGALGAINAYVDDVKEDTEGELSHKNLLDNPWFTVNQRGFTTTSFVTGNVYTVDRWFCIGSSNGGSVTLTANGLQLDRENEALTGYLSQFLEKITLGKPYTLSIMLADGTIVHKSGILATTSDEIHFNFLSDAGQARVYYYSGGSTWTVDILVFAGKSFTVRAIKLEIGTKSTLQNDVEPNKTTELLKCQRYFNRILLNSASAFIAVGFMADSHTFYGTINLSVPMRGTPTSSFGGVFQIYTTGGTENISTLLVSIRSPQILTIAATITNSLTVNSPAILMGDANAYIDISADL